MSFSTQDTIVAIATPPGRGGIGVVRLSGPHALPIGQQMITFQGALEPRRATFSRLRSRPATASFGAASDGDAVGSGIDHGVVTFFPGPQSYTGEDVVELSAHGSPVVLRALVEAAIARGGSISCKRKRSPI